MAQLVSTNRDKYLDPSNNNQVLPGVQQVTSIDSSSISSPTISSLTLPSSGTEVPFTFPANTKRFKVRTTNCSKFTVSYAAGGDTYTIAPKNEYCVDSLDIASLDIYFTPTKDGTVLEIESWT